MLSDRKLRIVATAALFAMVFVLAVATRAQRSKPDLFLWHTINLENEFEAKDLDAGFGWRGYLELENRLFAELDERVVRPSADGANPIWNRYAPGGVNNPATFPRNWNRSFELPTTDPVAGALLIHGLTDSPYSLRRTAEILHERGFHVVGLRLPGHGTTPRSLQRAEVEDWRAAVRIAYTHLCGTVGHERRILVVGYSNGGALSLDLALDALGARDLRLPDRMVLFSPAIGITRAAAFGRAHRLLSWMSFFNKLGWNGIEPELDPFKYVSFPNDAGYATHVLTRSVRKRLAVIADRQADASFPPVLTFMSLADATVRVEAVVGGLHDRLLDHDSELVIFDINRAARMTGFFRTDPVQRLGSLTTRETTPYRLTVITNIDETTDTLEEWTRPAGAREATVTPLDLAWPPAFYSLSHVAVPFPPDDPIYGFLPRPEPGFGIHLGALEPRGERGLLNIPTDHFNRLRSNPFFSYIEERLVGIAEGPTGAN